MDPARGESPAQFPGERSSGLVGMAPQVEGGQDAEDSAGDSLGRTVAGAHTCLDRRAVERPSYGGIRPIDALDQSGNQYLGMAGSTVCAQ